MQSAHYTAGAGREPTLLDTDFYKLTMQQAVFDSFQGVEAEYGFFARSGARDLCRVMPELRYWIERLLPRVRLLPEERDYLAGLGYFSEEYLDFLQGFRFDPDLVELRVGRKGDLRIDIRGPWLQTILYEVPLLALVNELYFSRSESDANYEQGRDRLRRKLALLVRAPELRFAEFGTRRRFSRQWQGEIVARIARSQYGVNLIGTSNVDLARRLNLQPVGTMAHEFLQAAQALTNLRDSQRFALRAWLRAFDGGLGIALTDVIGVDAFLRDFDRKLAVAYAGLRHDSGDPIAWGEKVLRHYEELGIDARDKTLVFSDGLNIPRAIEIQTHFAGRAKLVFGIGTNLTNDLGPRPLNIVIKMLRCNGRPVAKISDEPGKSVCPDPAFIERLHESFMPAAQRARGSIRAKNEVLVNGI